MINMRSGRECNAMHQLIGKMAVIVILGQSVMPQYVVNYAATQTADQGGRLDAPSFHRNHEPIWSVLGPFLADQSGDVLEVGSGTGQHVVEFARRAPAIRWQPSDPAAEHLRSIDPWRTTSGLANVRVPVEIDLSILHWPSLVEVATPGSLLAILCINVLHISPWHVSEHLLASAPRLVRPEGRLFVYRSVRASAAASTPRRAMPTSTRACGAVTPNGACATWTTSARSPSTPDFA